ncbi:MAG: hypothetical protein MR727_10665, partial [Lentisphaeria bacterium]|nr:hypothetical protein [Lentisphaeria bacterium]
ENVGTMILDATASPSNIRFPQDFSLLNEAREKTDRMIDLLHKQIREKLHPRTGCTGFFQLLRRRIHAADLGGEVPIVADRGNSRRIAENPGRTRQRNCPA